MSGAPPGDSFGFEASKQRGRGSWHVAWLRLRRNRLAILSAGILLLGAFMATATAVSPAIERHRPAAQDLDDVQSGPTTNHFFGTDNLGRDNWSRAWEGLRISLKVGLLAELVIVAVALLVGAGAAIGGRWADAALMRFTDVMYAFPELLAIILMKSVLTQRAWPIIGSGEPQIPGLPGELLQVILAIALVGWVTLARLIRGQLLVLQSMDYVASARAIGASPARVVVVHMLPNTLGPIIVAVTFGIPAAIFAEALLGFIGFSLAPPTASLGTLVSDGFRYYRVNPWMVMVPTVAIAAVMLCFTFLGDGLRDALDPRSRTSNSPR